MANGNATLAAARAGTSQSLVKGNQLHSELRVFFSTFTNTTATVIGEYISWGFLPLGARVLGGFLTVSAGTASSTLNLGDPASAARYLAAASVARLPPAPAAATATASASTRRVTSARRAKTEANSSAM